MTKALRLFGQFHLAAFFFLIVLAPHLAIGQVDTGLASALQQSLDDQRQQKQVQGISAAAYIPGSGMWVGTTGNSHAGTPIDSNMLLALASVTKTFIAAEILKLVDSGHLALEDTIGGILPPMTNMPGNITIRQLLNHTSGLGDYTHPVWGDAMLTDPNRVWGLRETLDSFLLAPVGLPGSPWNYCDANYSLLGLVIEAKAGDSLHKVLRSQLLQPLQLQNTFMEVLETYPNAIAHNWATPTMDPTLAADSSNTPHEALWSSSQAAGGLMSNAKDLATWGYNLYSGNVISQSALTEMLSFINLGSGYFSGYGLGTIRFKFHGRTYWGHGGNYYGYAASLLYHPETGTTLALLVNQDCISPHIAGEVMNTLLTYQATSVAGTSAPASFELYPNPAQSQLTIITTKAISAVQCYDAVGRLMKLSYSNHTADVSQLPDGLYSIKLTTKTGEQIFQRFIKKG